MQELKMKLEKRIIIVDELYNYYLEKYDENPNGKYFERKLNELRIEKRTLQMVIDMIENPSEYEVNE